MRYADILATALATADRADDLELPAVIDGFLRLVEARVNRILQTRNQSRRATLVTDKDTRFYPLPPDFAGMRHIVLKHTRDDISGVTIQQLSAENMTRHIASGVHTPSYSIVGNDLHVWPQYEQHFIELTYYQRITPLGDDCPENWLSIHHPDAYIQGLLVEICAFCKDAAAAELWNTRFVTTTDEITLEDAVDRWSGPTPTVRLA
jgi:hypothetical protein